MRHTTYRARLSMGIWSVGLLLAGMPLLADDAAWTRWGGPAGDFKVASPGIEPWPAAGPREVWSRELGGGHSGILVAGDRLYTVERREDSDVVLALDAASGELLWQHALESPADPKQTLQFGTGPNATPLLADGRLFWVTFTGKLTALDAEGGKPLWSRDLVLDFGAKLLQFGYSSAPVFYQGKVVLLVGGDQHGAVGLDPADGSLKWSTEPLPISYSSPEIIRIDKKDLLVFMTPQEVVGVSLANGKVGFRRAHRNRFDNNCAGPWWWPEESLLFVSSQADAGSRTLRLRAAGDSIQVEQVAKTKEFGIFHNNAIRRGPVLYGADGTFLVAHDIQKGKNLWKERGFPKVNLVDLGDGQAIGLDEDGNLHLLALSPVGVEAKAKYSLLEKPAWTPPTLVGKRLYVRNKTLLRVLDLSGAMPEKPGP